MQATITDVQKAIEQLGRGNDDGSRSFSFMSSRSQSTDHSEAEDEGGKDDEDEDAGYGWSKGARQMLAIRAQRENEKRDAEERGESTPSSGTPARLSGPPHDFEVSDESEDDDDDEIHLRHLSPSHISEESEDEQEPVRKPAFAVSHSRTSTMDFKTPPPPVITVTNPSLRNKRSRESSANIVPSEEFIVPSPSAAVTEIQTARPEKTTFTPEQLSSHTASEEPTPSPSMNIIAASPVEDTPSLPLSIHPPPDGEKPAAAATSSEPVVVPTIIHPTSPPTTLASVVTSPSFQAVSPSPSTVRAAETAQLPFPPSSPSASSFGGSTGVSSAGARQPLTPATTISMMSSVGQEVGKHSSSSSGSDIKKDRPDGHPSEWTVDQVVEWLHARGFDEGVCDKFTGACFGSLLPMPA